MNYLKANKLLLALALFIPYVSADPETCTYNTYQWDTKNRKAAKIQRVRKSYSEVTAIETADNFPCTVCEEDQVTFKVTNIRGQNINVTMCKYFAGKVKQALIELVEKGEPIFTLQAYRPGMTAGATDNNGLRTRFSKHSFGIALDINRDQNGLYKNCETPATLNSKCRLSHGGKWSPKTVGSLTKDSLTVSTFKRLGFKWGGEIPGSQKDFMHFSPTGY